MLAAILAVGLLGRGDGLFGENPGVEAQAAERPNIVFVLTDDLDERSMQDLSGIADFMGLNGITFDNAYVTLPLCCPSRATILRGQYAHNHDIIENTLEKGGGAKKFREQGLDQSTIATWLKKAGYRTGYIGKYLNDYEEGETYIPPGWDEWFVLNGDPREPFVNDNGQPITITGNSTDVFAQEASNFITTSSVNPEPFFAVVGTHAPHIPPAVAERHQGAFADTPLPKPPNFDEEFVDDKPQWVQKYPRLTQAQIDELEQLYRQRLRSMLAVEDLLQKIVATLQRTGELSNTYIFFTSDNGFHMGNHRLYPAGKQRPYEEDIGIPLMVRGPGVPGGTVRKELVINNDFAPTIAELAGASIPAFVDGSSFASLLTNSPPSSWRTAFLEEYLTGITHRAVHTQKYMFTEYDTGEHELYDLALDPYQLESESRADNEALYSELQGRLNSLRDCSGDACRNAEWGDTTPPRVKSTIPKANATAVVPTTNVTATFSEDMMVSSINTKTFKLLENGSTAKVAATVSYQASTDTATLDPTSSLKSGVSYKAVVTTGAKDVDGNPLDQNSSTTSLQQKTWVFTVG
jgi:arylsulfatase A-like enzyme